MVVRYKGKTSTIKSLPGVGPQGSLLGLFLFLLLINDAGFHGQVNNATSKIYVKAVTQIHLKYLDDMSVAEYVNLIENLVNDPDRQQPDICHARTGHKLPQGKSAVYQQLLETVSYVENN